MDKYLKQQFSYQLSLFPYTWAALEEKYPNILFCAKRYHKDGYLSFNPSEFNELQEDECIELMFLHILFSISGLPKEYVESMLASNIKKPFRYYIHSMSWDFERCKWFFYTDIFEEKYRSFLEYRLSSDWDEIFSGMDQYSLEMIRERIENTIEGKRNKLY